MRRITTLFLAVAALGLPAAARAQLYLGAGIGYSKPAGDLAQGAALADSVGGQVPVTVEAGFKLTPNLAVGAWFRLTPGWAGGDLATLCDVSGVDCGASGFAYGAAASWNFMPKSGLQPWAGVTIGYEQLELDLGGGDRMKLRGWEFLGVQLGADLGLGEHLAIGPYVGAGFGRYDEATLDVGGASVTADIPDKATHQWYTLGVRTRFTF